MAIEINHDLKVKASAAIVWEVITDLEKYSEWNPFMLWCKTTFKPGDVVDLKVKLGKQVRQEQEVMVEYNEGVGFSYQMKPPPLGALKSFRTHRIESVDDTNSVYHSTFKLEGWLSPVVVAVMGKHLKTGFDGMSHAIRDRAEKLAADRAA